MSIPHNKHAKLEKSFGGQFHRIEFGFLGAPCSVIQKLCRRIASNLEDDHLFGYVDADHGSGDATLDIFNAEYTDKIKFKRIDSHKTSSDVLRFNFQGCSAVLVNGNHFKSDRQIVIINREKENSLRRKLDRLTNVVMIVLDEGEQEIYPFLQEHLKSQNTEPLVCRIEESHIEGLINRQILNRVSEVNGLILGGGRSQRMGEDKRQIVYHEKPQLEHMADLAAIFCSETFISLRNEEHVIHDYPFIADTFLDLGPYGGILSAFRKYPNRAWLTLPCDAPFIDEELIAELFTMRNKQKVATCFLNPETNFPEPLITIWEPKAYSIMLQFLCMGYSCPRKVLINSDIELLNTDFPQKLFNANTPEERDFSIRQLSK